MCMKLVLVLCLFTFCHTTNAASASFIKKCHWDDSKCMKDSAQAALPIFSQGIPELGIEKLDPLHYDEIDASSATLKLLLSDITIDGVQDCQVKKVQRNNPLTKLSLKGICTVNLNGNYEVNGRLLLLPIEGKGKIHVVLRKLVISVDADMFEKIGKDGQKHWDLKSWKHSYELKDKADIDLENLFPGNEVLGMAARDLLNTSANEVIGEVGPPIVKAILAKVVKHVHRFFKAVPIEELSLD